MCDVLNIVNDLYLMLLSIIRFISTNCVYKTPYQRLTKSTFSFLLHITKTLSYKLQHNRSALHTHTHSDPWCSDFVLWRKQIVMWMTGNTLLQKAYTTSI